MVKGHTRKSPRGPRHSGGKPRDWRWWMYRLSSLLP